MHILIAPLIIDENGEQLIYTSKKFPHLKNGGDKWTTLMSSDFYAGEAGGATKDVFEAVGGDRNAWPDGKLSFAALDTFEQEPTPAIKVLMNDRLSLSPHIGAATQEAQDRIGTELASQIISILKPA